MDRIKLLEQCRYYSGEQECPFSSNALKRYWNLEQVYVEQGGKLNTLEDGLYKSLGGKEYVGIPRALLITMFSYWGKGTYDLKAYINSFYELIDTYLEIVAEQFPKDKIPHNRK